MRTPAWLLHLADKHESGGKSGTSNGDSNVLGSNTYETPLLSSFVLNMKAREAVLSIPAWFWL